MNRQWVGNLVLRLGTPSANLEAVAIPAIIAVLVGPAGLKRHRFGGVDAIEAVIAVVPGTALVVNITRAASGGMAAEAIGVAVGVAVDTGVVVGVALVKCIIGRHV